MKNFIIAFLLLILLNACGTMGGGFSPVSYPNKVTADMQSLFDQAESAYKNRNYDVALASYKNYLETTPYNKLSDEASYKIAKIQFLRQNFNGAIDTLTALSEKTPDKQYKAKAYLMAGYAAYQQGEYARATSHLLKGDDEKLTDKLKLQYYSLTVLAGKKAGTARDRIDWAYLRLADLYADASEPLNDVRNDAVLSQPDVNQGIDTFVNAPMTTANFPGWYNTYPKGLSRGTLDYKMGKTYYEAHEEGRAREYLSKFVRSNPKSPYVNSANQLLEKLGGAVKVADTVKGALNIGVLLPLSGAQKAFGESALRGINCAAAREAACKSVLSEKPVVNLIIRDSGSDGEQIREAVRLLDEAGVSAIIGPLSAQLAQPAAEEAQKRKIVIMPITQKSQLMSVGGFVFQMGYPADKQVSDIIAAALDRKMRNIAVYSPNTPYGKEMTDVFLREASLQGARVAAKATYNVGSPDLAAQAVRLVGAKIDAIFIPDSYRFIGAIAQTLTEGGVTAQALLGTNVWNDPSLSATLLVPFPRSFFVDVFDPSRPRNSSNGFVNIFRSSFGHAPTSIEALGFDAVWFLKQAAIQAGSIKSGKIQESLLSGYELQGVTGILGFEEGKGPRIKELHLTARDSGIGSAD